MVVGSGGREHALAWKLAAEAGVTEVVCAPGNAGIGAVARCVPIPAGDIDALAGLAAHEHVGLTVVGPELPLDRGIVDLFRARRLPIFGPSRAAAQLECSKVFAKEFMARHGVPTARYRRVRIRAAGLCRNRLGRARLSGRRQGGWARRREGRGGCGRSCRGRVGRARGNGGTAVRRCRRAPGDRGMPRWSRSVVLRHLRRPPCDAALVRPGSQAGVRRRPGPEHRRDGRLRAEPAPRPGARVARDARHRHPRRRRPRGRRTRVLRLPVRRSDAHRRGAEGHRVQRALRRSGGPGGHSCHCRGPRAAAACRRRGSTGCAADQVPAGHARRRRAGVGRVSGARPDRAADLRSRCGEPAGRRAGVPCGHGVGRQSDRDRGRPRAHGRGPRRRPARRRPRGRTKAWRTSPSTACSAGGTSGGRGCFQVRGDV